MPYQNYQQLTRAFREAWGQYLVANLDRAWNWSSLSSNDNIDADFITQHPELPWVPENFVFNDTLGWDFFQPLIESERHQPDSKIWHHSYFWGYLSEHPKITMEHVMRYSDQPWEKSSLVLGKQIGQAQFTKYFLESEWCSVLERRWAYYWASGADWVTIQFILSHPYYNWDWETVVARSDVTPPQLVQIIQLAESGTDPYQEVPDPTQHPLSWRQVSRNPNLTYRFVVDHPEYLWNWDELSRNPGISVDTILANVGQPWNWDYVCFNPTWSWSHLAQAPDQPWNWDILSLHPNVTWERVQANPDLPWNWERLSYNPNIGWEQVEQYPQYAWDYDELSRNKMTGFRERWIQRTRLQWIAARRIHRFWRDVTSDPVYQLARRLLVQTLHT